jgi:hypothetical protein
MEQSQTADSFLPDWLSPRAEPVAPVVPTHLLDPQERKRLTRELLEATFAAMFERVLTDIIRGHSLRSILAKDMREIDYEAFWRWMKRDSRRMNRYDEALELQAEFMSFEVIDIADGVNSIDPSCNESVNRDRMRIDTRWRYMETRNRKRYGQTKQQFEFSASISITAAMEQGRSRVAALPSVEDIIDVDDPVALPAPDNDDNNSY